MAGVLLVPSLAVLALGSIPDLNAIWWLGLILLLLAAWAGACAVVLGMIGIAVAVRRRSRFVLSVIGAALGVVLILPMALLQLSSAG